MNSQRVRRFVLAFALLTNLPLLLASEPADFNDDGLVDLVDFEHLKSCRTGPAVPQTIPSCQDADLDDDGDVDHSDFGILQQTYGITGFAVTVEDASDIVTKVDLGFNDFGGNMGAVNSNALIEVGMLNLHCDSRCWLRFTWDFGPDPNPEAFTGLFASLFNLTSTVVTQDGETTETVTFPEHALDLDRVDGDLNEPGGPRRFETLWLSLSNPGAEDIVLRIELKDAGTGLRFRRITVPATTFNHRIGWEFRNPAAYATLPGRPDLNIHTAKELTLIVERRHTADGVVNPVSGTLDVHHIWWVLDRPEVLPVAEDALLDHVERRLYQYFLDFSSRKAASQDLPQDRSSFPDLLSIGGAGFALPAHVIGAERNWIPRADAAQRVLNMLRLLDDATFFGPEPVGRIGYRGFLYHFLGTDGKRKLNFDFSDSGVDESLNTVELSWIDTSLAVIGVLAAQSYFDDDDPVEAEIRSRAQSIYDRVDWPFMLDVETQQFYLAWKPNEEREGPAFEIPDAQGLGAYSGIPGDPATLDFYTDEALIGILLAVGSETHPVSPYVYCHLSRDADQEGLIRTYPGSLFTYQFLGAFLDPALFVGTRPGETPIDWSENSQQAISTAIEYASDNPDEFATYGTDAWGISAAEGPSDAYHAYGAPPVARAMPHLLNA